MQADVVETDPERVKQLTRAVAHIMYPSSCDAFERLSEPWNDSSCHHQREEQGGLPLHMLHTRTRTTSAVIPVDRKQASAPDGPLVALGLA